MASFLRIAAIAPLAMLLLAPPASAADHLEAPTVRTNGALDLNDLYVFESLENSDNAIFAMTVNPFAGQLSGTTFQSNNAASYQFQIDNDGDAVADVVYTASFQQSVAGVQGYSISRTQGSTAQIIGAGTTGAISSFAGGFRATAGTFDDPFFFDLDGFNDGFNFTGTDAFAGANVSGIVLEVPKTDFLIVNGGTNVGVQAVTEENGMQFDRMGRPAVATALIPDGQKDAYNQGEPATDFAEFGDEVNATILSLSNQANADALTPVLLPDLLTYDTAAASGFLNGRRLQDDVIDATLGLVSAGAVPTDFVDANDNPFLNVFPYLAAPNVTAVPEPASMALVAVMGLGYWKRRRNEVHAKPVCA